MEERSDKYTYVEGDLELGDSQCSICIFFDTEKKVCKKIGAIPDDVLKDIETCSLFGYEE